MRRIPIALLLACLAAPAVFAQDAAESNEEKYQHKLEKEFVKKVPWVMKLDEAMAKAKEQNKLILGYFSRSYAP